MKLLILANEEKNDNQNYIANNLANVSFIIDFNKFNNIIRKIHYDYRFNFHNNYGFLTSNIELLARGICLTCEIYLDELCGLRYDENEIMEK